MAQYRIGDADLNSLPVPTSSVRTATVRARHCPTSACGRRCWRGCKRSSTPSRRTPRRGADTGRFPQQRNLPARAAPRQRGRKRRPGAAGAYRTGADRRSGGLVPGRNRPAAEAMAACGITPLRLRIRDGLALTNGTAVMTGIGLVNLAQARRLLGWAVKASVMLNEMVESYDDFMAGALNEYKLHAGQISITQADARHMRHEPPAAQARSGFLQRRHGRGTHLRHKVQPYYSLGASPTWGRCSKRSPGRENPRRGVQRGGRQPSGEPHGGDDLPRREFPRRLRVAGDGRPKIAVTKMTMLAEQPA